MVRAVDWLGARRSAKLPAIGERTAPTAVTTVTRAPICQRAAPNSSRSGVARTAKMTGAKVDDVIVVASTVPNPIRRNILGHARADRGQQLHRRPVDAGTGPSPRESGRFDLGWAGRLRVGFSGGPAEHEPQGIQAH